MREYPRQNWKALGDWVYDARLQAGQRDMEQWADLVGRSTRVLRGLERGEPQGIGTVEAVAAALSVADWRLLDILRDPRAASELPSHEQAKRSRQTYEAEVGHPSAETVGGVKKDASTLLFRRPDSMSDADWERLRAAHEDLWEWQIERTAKERDDTTPD